MAKAAQSEMKKALAEEPLNIDVAHVRSKLGWARQQQLDAFVKKNGIGETLTFEQLKTVLELVGVGDEKHGVVIDVGGRFALSEDAVKDLKAIDTDGSGVVTLAEFVAYVKKSKATEKEKGRLTYGIVGLFIITIGLVGAILGVTLAANEMSKESHVSGEGLMVSTEGTAVQVGIAESETTLWDTALLSPYQLGKIVVLSFYVDLDGEWVSFAAKTASAYKTLDDETATIFTPEGHKITLSRTAQSGTIKMASGSTYAIAEEPPSSVTRELREHESANFTPVTESRRRLAYPGQDAYYGATFAGYTPYRGRGSYYG
jgi:hypothetical protein